MNKNQSLCLDIKKALKESINEIMNGFKEVSLKLINNK